MSSYKKYRVVKKVKESSRVVSLYLRPADETEPVLFRPGQHLMFKFHLPGKEIPAFRYYSFSECNNSMYYRVSVKKEPAPPGMSHLPGGLCSSYVYDVVKEGDILEAKGPIGDFVLDTADNSPVVLIAGGIGITPLLCMIKSVARENPARKVWLFYGVNEKSEHSFCGELDALKKNYPHLHIHTFYNNVQDGDEKGSHYDYEGFVNAEIILQQTGNAGLRHYMCGPPVMMKFVTEALIRLGVSADKIHTESFTSSAIDESWEEVNTTTQSHDENWSVEFTASQKKLPWDSRYKSILEFAEANDIEIDSGCLFGDCGTCLTKLIEGNVQYTHPTMISPDKGTCLPCSCVPVSNVILKA